MLTPTSCYKPVDICCVVTLENDAQVMELSDLLSLSFCGDFDTEHDVL